MIFCRNIEAFLCTLALLLCLPHCIEAHTLDEILARGSFSICVDPDGMPFSQRSGPPAGFEIDLAQVLADRMGVRLDIDWIAMRGAARRVNCDAIMASLAQAHDGDEEEHKPARVLRAALTHSYARETTRIVIAADSPPVQTLDDLRGRSVAVIHASFAHYLFNQKHIAVRTLYPSQEEILAAVASKEMSAGVVADWIFDWYQKTHPDSGLRILDALVVDPDLDYNVAITLRNTDAALVEKVNAVLDALKTDGSLVRLFAAYGITYRAPSNR
jgi:polar amino acid transport system substrate-binding protein